MVKSCWNIIYANAPVAAIYRTDTFPGIVVKVDLTTFTRVGAVTLNTGETYFPSAVVSGNYAYFG